MQIIAWFLSIAERESWYVHGVERDPSRFALAVECKYYHYAQCGLDNVWLGNGVIFETHPDYGELVSIRDVDGLHAAISQRLVCEYRLTGSQLRFLRTGLDLSPHALADRLGVGEQAVAAWEAKPTELIADEAADARLRIMIAAQQPAF